MAWASATLRRVREAGFKGIGAWSNAAFHTLDVPMSQDLNLWAWAHGTRLYSPAWREAVEAAVQQQVVPLKDNKHLVGYYTDNELNWGDDHVGPAAYFNGLPTGDPNRAQVVAEIRETWPDVASFNADWGLALASFDDLDQLPALPLDHPEAYQRLFTAFLQRAATDYFRLTTELVKRYDPNHLVLGVRFKGYAPVEVVRGSRGYTDAQSLNYYVSDARLDRKMFEMMHAESGGQPVIITEYSFHALDGRSGNRNTFGFAAQVMDQAARADGYRLGTTRLARVPWVIGADWFQWSDEPPSGRADGEDVNFGVVDVDDRPYKLLTDAIRQTTPRLNALHAASVTDARADVWRPSYDDEPVVNVPYIAPGRAPVMNGELSDWPAEARLLGLRHSETIGTDRHALPPPNVFLAWNETGFYLGAEVFDADIQGAPANGWWWSRDNFEFWINTHPVAGQTWYTPQTHQFFFVPIAFPAEDGAAGVVGQWHRNGDALAESLVPHPKVIDATRVLPDRYVVELFIPAGSLTGFDAASLVKDGGTWSFNFNAHNFQTAIDYFWSAPKEVLTQYRPNTWGTMRLLPPAE